MKCLEKDRTRRYETATGLAADITRHLSDEPVLASPPSTAYRLRKFARRNRGQVIATVIVLCALILGIAGTTSGLVWALDQKERAEVAEADAVARAVEVDQVAAFQSKQLSTIHPHKMGDHLRTALLREASAAERLQLETMLDSIDLTGIALGLLEAVLQGYTQSSAISRESRGLDGATLTGAQNQVGLKCLAIQQIHIESVVHDRDHATVR